MTAFPLAPPPPLPATPGRATDQRGKAKFTGREKGATRSFPDRGETPQPFPPRPPSRPRSLRSPESPPRKKRRATRPHPNRRATLTAPGAAPPRGCPRCQTQAPRALPFHRGKARRRPEAGPTAAAHPPHQPRTAPGTRTMPLYAPQTFEKYAPCRGGWLVGLRSMSTDLTPSKSKGGSEVGKHYSPTHQPPKNKVKNKNKNKGQGQGQGQGQNHHRYRSSKRRGSDQAAVQKRQRARVKPASGEDDSKTEQVKPARAKGTASRLRYSKGRAGVRA